MSNPYGPTIETLADWNAALTCCCDMPSCPVPVKTCRSRSVTACGWLAGAGDPFETETFNYVSTTGEPTDEFAIVYTKVRVTAEASDRYGFGTEPGYGADYYDQTQETYYSILWSKSVSEAGACVLNDPTGSWSASNNYTLSYEGTVAEDYDLQIAYNSSASGTVEIGGYYGWFWNGGGTEYSTYAVSGPGPTYATGRTASSLAGYYEETDPLPYWTGAVWTSPRVNGTLVISYEDPFDFIIPPDAAWTGMSCASSRDLWVARESGFRWDITGHTGEWFKITWDVVFFPDVGDPVSVLTDETWEWTGGDMLSDWYEIPVPTTPGESRVVNIRYSCYRSPYGTPVETTGEGVDLTPP